MLSPRSGSPALDSVRDLVKARECLLERRTQLGWIVRDLGLVLKDGERHTVVAYLNVAFRAAGRDALPVVRLVVVVHLLLRQRVMQDAVLLAGARTSLVL